MKKEKKETYTYATTPSAHRTANRRAKALGSSLSKEIDKFIKRFNAQVKRKSNQILKIETAHNVQEKEIL